MIGLSTRNITIGDIYRMLILSVQEGRTVMSEVKMVHDSEIKRECALLGITELQARRNAEARRAWERRRQLQALNWLK